MYSIDWPAIFRAAQKRAPTARSHESVDDRPNRVSPVVWSLGFTSLLTDISSEMVASVLPVYLVLHLRMSPMAFGVVDGIYQGFAALFRLASGFAGDYTRRHKAVATTGYGLSAFCRIGLLFAGNAWTAIAAIVALDRTGKGIRTAPRDALISASSPATSLAHAFGVHRSLDAAGAMLGPLAAFVFLVWMPSRFDVIFVVSFCVAIVGVGVIGLFVQEPSGVESDQLGEQQRPSIAAALGLWRRRQFRLLLIASSVLGLATMSDAFVFLTLQERIDFSAGLFPLLFVGVSLTNFVLSAPTGRLADRAGRLKILLAGHGLLLILYLVLLLPRPTSAGLILCLVLLGAYYAATDGVLAAIAASSLPRELCGSGLALLATATNVSRLLSSLVFGGLWNSWGSHVAALCFILGMGLALAVSVFVLRHALGRAASMAA